MLISPVEPIEDPVASVCRNPRACVGDVDDGPAVAAGHANRHLAALRRELDGVVDKVDERLAKDDTIGDSPPSRCMVDLDPVQLSAGSTCRAYLLRCRCLG